MSTKQYRAGVNQHIKDWAAAAFPTLPVIYENGPVPDEDKIGRIWLDLEIRWYGSQQLAFSDGVPKKRHSGAISANVFYREAAGTGLVDDIVDSLSNSLQCRRLAGGLIMSPQRTVPTHLKGWYKSGLLFPFTLDD